MSRLNSSRLVNMMKSPCRMSAVAALDVMGQYSSVVLRLLPWTFEALPVQLCFMVSVYPVENSPNSGHQLLATMSPNS